MNNKFIVSFLLFILCACTTSVSTNNAKISFLEKSYDFGSLAYRKEAGYSFQFTNPGEGPLVVLDVKTSCGCTVPAWPDKPVKPGGSGEIKVKYDAAHPGVFHKTITVYYNGKDSPVELTIKGEVAYPDDLEEIDHEE